MTVDARRMVCVYAFRYWEHGPEFLLLLRSPGRYMAGTWQPVTGGVESGETAWQAALRELREETGLAPVRFYQADGVETFYVAKTDTVHHCPVFAAEVPGDAEVRLNAENTDADWVHVQDLTQRLMWPGQRRAVAEIVQEIVNGGASKPYLEIEIEHLDD